MIALSAVSEATVSTHVTDNLGLIIVGGTLVGLGTRIGNGCTFGHGVCGTCRLSRRGLIATCTFIAAAALTVARYQLIGAQADA